jgi:GcrA cell cycle regulator
MSGMPWTPDLVERVKALWKEGYTAAQIAARVGAVSRNAVIGVIHRAGLSGLRKEVGQQAKPVAARPPTRIAKRSVPRPAARPAAAAAAPVSTVASAAAPPAGGVHLFALREDLCRRPLFGDRRHLDVSALRFCGAAVAPGSSWCPACRPRMIAGKAQVSRRILEQTMPPAARERAA